MLRTRGILPVPSSEPAIRSELGRLERELERRTSGRGRTVLAIERRRALVALELLEERAPAAA